MDRSERRTGDPSPCNGHWPNRLVFKNSCVTKTIKVSSKTEFTEQWSFIKGELPKPIAYKYFYKKKYKQWCSEWSEGIFLEKQIFVTFSILLFRSNFIKQEAVERRSSLDWICRHRHVQGINNYLLWKYHKRRFLTLIHSSTENKTCDFMYTCEMIEIL